MLIVNGVKVRTNIHQYTCLDCGHDFIGTRNTACPACAGAQTMPTTSLSPRRRAEFKWQQRFFTEAPFTTG